MTTLASTTSTTAGSSGAGRRLLVILAIVYVALFAALMLSGGEHAPDDDPASLIAAHETSHAVISVTSYAGMVACALLVFYGAALRGALTARGGRWTADAAFVGFVVMAITLGTWMVSALALWHAEDIGDEAAVRAMNLVDTSNFLPAMLAMICAMVGTGLTGLATKALPRWASVASVFLGCLAPLGPAAFVPFILFPVWMVVVAATVRLSAVDA